MQCVANFIGNSFVVQRRLFAASCLKQIKSYASRHRKAFRRKHFFTFIHPHLRHPNHQNIIANNNNNTHIIPNHLHLANSHLIHSIVQLNHAPHVIHLICISFTSFIVTSIVNQSILQLLRIARQEYFRNFLLRAS